MKGISSLSKREKYILFITVGIILTCVIYNFLISPVIKKSKQMNQQFRQKTIKLQKSLQVLNRAKLLQDWHNSIPFNLKASEIRQDGVTKIKSYIVDISKKNLVQIINISSPGEREEHENYKFIFISLALKGQMENIIDFIYDIESSPMMFTVDKLQFSSIGEESGNVKVFLEIRKLIII